jgi:hypothetical protein
MTVWSPALLSPGDTLTAEEVNTLLSGPYYQLNQTGVQSIGNASNTPISFDNVVEYNSRYSSITAPTTLITAPIDGLYLAIGTAALATNATGCRQAWLSMAGTSVGGVANAAPSGTTWASQVVGIKRLSAADQIKLYVFQNSGTAVGTSPSTLSGCSLTVRWLGL